VGEGFCSCPQTESDADIKLDTERWTLWEVGICLPKREFEFSKTVNTKASPGRSEE
jgi:hypothetical protein